MTALNRKPLYTESHSGSGYGDRYEAQYAGSGFHSRVWTLEQQILLQVVKATSGAYMDFACGTGRVLSFLEARMQTSTGIDVSAEMLQKARQRVTRSRLLQVNLLEENLDPLPMACLDLITAFRFFLNAEDDLRRTAFACLGSLLAPGGRLVFNIHGNKLSLRAPLVLLYNGFKSLYYAVAKRQPGIFSFRRHLSRRQVLAYLKEAGLVCESTYSYAFIPYPLASLFPERIWRAIETLLVNKRLLFGTHLIFVCRRASTGSSAAVLAGPQ